MPGPSDSNYSRLPSELLDLQPLLDILSDEISTKIDELGENVLNSPIFEWTAVKQNNFQAIDGAWERTIDASHWSGAYLTNPDRDQDDEAALGAVFVPITTNYTLYLVHRTSSASGITHFLFNNVSKGSLDCYTGGGVSNVVSSVSLGSLTAGIYVFSLIVSEKYASASDYACDIQTLAIAKT